MNLIDLYPKELLCERVPVSQVSFVEYGLSEIEKIVGLKENCMFELGGTIWDKYIQTHPDVDPMSLAIHFQTGNPSLYKEVSNFVGTDVIKDILYIHTNTDDSSVDYKDFSELLIAVLHQNILHISDVEFSNPLEPMKPSERQSEFQAFRGLNLFGELVDRCVTYSKEHNLDRICLTAAHISLVPFFEKYGFVVDDTPTGKHGMAYGSSIPMTRLV